MSGPVGQNLAEAMFPNFEKRARVFGFDWLGRQASIDLAREANGQPAVLLLEPDPGQALEVPVGFEDFHNNEIVDFPETQPFYRRSFNDGRTSIGRPFLFLPNVVLGTRFRHLSGGSDTVDNLAVEDFEVYRDLSGRKTRRPRNARRYGR